jgi:hypothetical protein
MDDKGDCAVQADFHVNSDGQDEDGIRDCVLAAVKEWRGKVKASHLSRAVVNQLDAVASSGYGYLLPGLIEDDTFVDFNWRVEVGSRGRVAIEQTA